MATANRLAEVLTEQVALLQELQQNLQDEQKALVDLDVTAMESLNSTKEQLLARQRVVADSLRQTMADTAVKVGLAPSASLSELIEALPTSMRSQIMPLQQVAKQAGSAVSVLASQNRGMLEQFLGVVNDSLAFILRILSTSNTYGVRGTYLNNSQSGAVMINREV